MNFSSLDLGVAYTIVKYLNMLKAEGFASDEAIEVSAQCLSYLSRLTNSNAFGLNKLPQDLINKFEAIKPLRELISESV